MIAGASLAIVQHLAAAAFVALDTYARAKRTIVLLPMPLGRAVSGNLAGDAAAAVTPARLGGDPTRFVWFTRAGHDAAATIAAFATETLINGIILAAGALLFAVLFAGNEMSTPTTEGGGIPWLWVGGGVVLLVLVGWALLGGRRKPVAHWLPTLKESWRKLQALSPAQLRAATWWTLLSFVARGGILPALLIGTPDITAEVLWLSAIGALYVLLLAPTPAGAGVVELSFFLGLRRLFGVGELAWLIATWRFYAYAATALLGGLILLRTAATRRKAVSPSSNSKYN